MSAPISLGDVLRIKAVRWTLAVNVFWYLGAMALTVALGIHVYDISGSKRALGLLGLVEFVPTAVLVLVSGSVADRFDRRLLATVAIALELVVLGALIAVASSSPTTVTPFLIAAFSFGVIRAFSAPAMRALLPATAPEEYLPRIVSLGSVSWQSAVIAGPVIGSWAYKRAPEVAYGAAAALIGISLICMRLIPKSVGRAHLDDAPQERPTLRAAMQGLTVMRRTPILLGAIALDLFAVLFGGAVALIPAIVKDSFGGNPGNVALLRVAGGVGAALVTVALAVRPLDRHVGKWLLAAVGVFGAATVVFGFSESLLLSAAAMFVLHAADSVSVFIRGTLVPLVTPAAERGRVLAVEAVFIGASNELGAFESGELAHHIGTVGSIVSGGVITMVIVAVWWFAFRPLREIDRFEDAMSR